MNLLLESNSPGPLLDTRLEVPAQKTTYNIHDRNGQMFFCSLTLTVTVIQLPCRSISDCW